MILIRGQQHDLKGSAIIYWDIVKENRFAPGSKVLAIHFTISPLTFENKLLTASFPPIPYQDLQSLLLQLENIHCDLLYGGKILLHLEDLNMENFFQEEFNRYHQIIEEYVELYKEKLEFLSGKKFNTVQKLVLIKDLLQNLAKPSKKGKKNSLMKILWLLDDLDGDFINQGNLRKLLSNSGEKVQVLRELYVEEWIAASEENYEKAGHIHKKIIRLEKESKAS